MNPALYVTPALGSLLTNMNHALEMEIRARKKAEVLHTRELHRRVEAERKAAELAAENAALMREMRAWSSAATKTFADTLSRAFVDSLSSERRDPAPPAPGGSSGNLLTDIGTADSSMRG